MSGSTDEQNRLLLWGTTFAFQTDRESFNVFGFFDRLEVNMFDIIRGFS